MSNIKNKTLFEEVNFLIAHTLELGVLQMKAHINKK